MDANRQSDLDLLVAAAERALEQGERLRRERGIPGNIGAQLRDGGVLTDDQKRQAAEEFERLMREAERDLPMPQAAGAPRPMSPFDLLRR